MAAHKHEFFAALRNDFNTPAALAAMDGWIREANRRAEGVGDADLREMLGVLGLGELTPLQSADAASRGPRGPGPAGRARAGALRARLRAPPTASGSSCASGDGRCATDPRARS